MNDIAPGISLLSIIFMIVLSVGFFLSLMLFLSHKGNPRANKVLSLLIFLFSLLEVWDILVQSRTIILFPHMLMLLNPLIYSLGPLIYFYVLALTSIEWKFKARSFLHFLPVVSAYLYFAPVYLLPGAEKLRLITDAFTNHHFIIPRPFFLLAVVYILIYLLFSIRRLHVHAITLKDTFSSVERLSLRWLKYMLFIFMVLLVFFAARILFPLQIIWNFSAFLTLASMYIIGFFGYNQPIIYQQSGKETRTPILQEEKKKYATSSLTKTEMREHAKKLEGLMEHDKLYLKNDLKIGLVAEKLDLPMHHVSQILNEHLGKNFFDFVNEYRVNEVKRRMADSQYDYLTILAIGYDSGFNSKTAFYSAFKRNTGLIPSEYKNTLVHAETTS